MLLRLSIDHPDVPVPWDIGIECAADQTVGEVLDLLVGGLAVTGTPSVDGVPLDRDQEVEGSPLRDGVVLDCTSAHRRPRPARPDTLLKIVSGPDAGRVVELVPGQEVLVGRGSEVDLALRDGDVSRKHLAISLTTAGIQVVDLDSANGTRISRDGSFTDVVKLPARVPVALPPGERVQLGGTRIEAVQTLRRTAELHGDGRGGLLVSRAPQPRSRWSRATVTLPTRSHDHEENRPSLLLGLVGSAGMAVMAFTIGRAMMLLFLACSVLVGILSWWFTKRMARKARERREGEYSASLVAAQRKLHDAADDEDDHLRAKWLDPVTVQHTVESRSTLLWHRRRGEEDWLRLRLGSSTTTPSTEIRGTPPDQWEPAGWSPPRLVDAPVGVQLTDTGALGVVGNRSQVSTVLNDVLLQAAACYGPDELKIAVVAPGHDELMWTRWLPHVRQPDSSVLAAWHVDGVQPLVEFLTELVRQDDTDPRASWSTAATAPHTLVVLVDAGPLVKRPDVHTLLSDGVAAGLRFVCTDENEARLPSVCSTVLTLDGPDSRLTADDGSTRTVRPDTLDSARAEELARLLAPLRTMGADGVGGIPDVVRLADVVPDTSREAIEAAWRVRPASTSVVIGADATGPFAIDLAEHGPHGVVLGIPGSGKSEFLVSLLLGLALANTPERLNFLFVDYKGGATFKDLRKLPHCTGVVTNISGSPTRVLTSLRAELDRRQRLFDRAGAAYLDDYSARREAHHDLPPIARLVVVVDEFAELNARQPDALEQLVSIVLTGRSLGVHLLLASQSSNGISDTIKKNASLGVCLKVSRTDSDVVLDSPVASTIGKFQHGRAFVRRGDELRQVQTTWAAAPVGGKRTATARVVPLRHDDLAMPAQQHAAQRREVRTDLDDVVDALVAASDGLRPPHPMWRDPLPPVVLLDDLVPARHQLVLGLRDRPERQEQGEFTVPLGTGHLLVVGGAQSGRTSALRAVAIGLAKANSPREAHLHVIDSHHALEDLAELPHSGVVTSADDRRRVDRLLEHLEDLTRSRRLLISERGASVAEQWTTTPGTAPAQVVLLIDGAEAIGQAHEAGYERLVRIMQAGQATGITVCLAVRENAVRGTLTSQFAHQLCLRLTDNSKASQLGLGSKVDTTVLPPGRAYLVSDGSEVHLPLPSADLSGAGQRNAVRHEVEAAKARWREVATGPDLIRVDALPRSLPLTEALEMPGRPDGASWTLLGVGGDLLRGHWVDMTADKCTVVVAGPRRSGRSTAVSAMAAALAAAGSRVVLVPSRSSEAHAHAERHGVHVVRPGDLGAALDAGVDVVVVDDAEATGISAADQTRMFAVGGPGLIASADLEKLTGFGQGMVKALSGVDTGIVLSPHRGTWLGTQFGNDDAFSGPPGRAYFVRDGEKTAGQVPDVAR
ncbi:FtsK/SpoIIIE domain-containing protein [Umezawaea sp. NPDC059074]|uniref:FtsK/SpoIIIE domain-containing protein n=1 Tax=Umezawaea sp. NPDC059074 TaxID=3346716 RepID=UPI00367B1AC4